MTMQAALRVIRAGSDASSGTDGELLRQFAEEGDQDAFAAVFDRHAGMVLGVCRRALSDPRDAEDACQATFLVLARKARAVGWRASIANWLHATARKVARNARVAAQRRTRREAVAAVPEAVPPADRMTAREMLEALDEELARLPARYREPLVLCYLEGLTRDQAARRLGLRSGTVKIRLERGRRRLADALTARGTTPGAVLLATAVAANASPRFTAPIGIPPAARVAALADGVIGARVGVVAALGAVVVAVGLIVGVVVGNGQVADPPKKAEANPPAVANDAFGDPLPHGAIARFGSTRFRPGMWPWYVLPSPDGSKLATIGGNGQHAESLTIWDAAGRPLRKVGLGGAKVESARWMPDGRGFAVLKLDTAQYAVWEFTDENATPPAVINEGNINRLFVGTIEITAVSPDGKLVAGASRTANNATFDHLEVWAFTPGKLLRAAEPKHTIDTTDGFVWLGFTPDSKQLIGVTRHQEPNQPGKAGPGQPIPVVPGAKADTAKAFVWDMATGKEIRTFETPGGMKKGYAISPDGTTLYAAGEKGRVAGYDLATGKEVFAADVTPPGEKREPHHYLTYVTVSADGRTLFVVENMKAVIAFDTTTGKQRWWHGDRDMKQIYALAPMPDSKKFVLGCVDGRLVFRDTMTGKETAPTPEYRGWYLAVALDGAGKVAFTSGVDGAFRKWDVATGRELGKVELTGYTGFHAIAFSPDRKLVIGQGWSTESKAVPIIADATTGRMVTQLKAETESLFPSRIYGGRAAAWLPDGSVLLCQKAGAVRFATDGKEIRTYTPSDIGEGGEAWSVAVSPDGKRVALAGRGRRNDGVFGWVAVFDAETGKAIRTTQSRHELIGVAFTADGESVLVSGWVYAPQPERGPDFGGSTTQAVGLFDVASGEIRYPFADSTDGMKFRNATVLTVSPTGYQFAVMERDNTITLYELASGAVRRQFRGHANQIYQLAFSPDGSKLVSVSWDGTGLVWDVNPPKSAPLTNDAERLKRWELLLSTSGETTHKAMGELAADPAEALKFLKANFKPTTVTDVEIDKLIVALESEVFADREAASAALDKLGGAAVPRVKAQLAKFPAAEVRRRLGEFLKKHDRRDQLTGPRLRERRTIELLESFGTAEAKAYLGELARPGTTPLAHDAAAALGRLRAVAK